MPSVHDIRRQFLEFFAARGHALPGSAPLVPMGDDTLMFTNAGMVPFKGYFTGTEAPAFARAATAQKCVRAGGKHNDLDNVGYTARHHTFFEMLGNFSFGDYFKEQAIAYAWELITKDFALPKAKLLVTVYAEDDEAAGLWRKISGLSDRKIIRIASDDNFWSMGDTGPCGPCSEIFYDHGAAVPGGPPGSPEQDGDRFVEIWNLVFMQFDQRGDGARTPLPKPSIDTGMGLERLAAVLQGVHSNYETDLFQALIAASVEATGVAAEGADLASHRIIADHLRASAFLIADGVMPAPEGRGYVLRRIMRRAMRHAHLLGAKDPLLHRLAPTLIALMGEAYPELVRAEASIAEQLRQEEERFRRTLGRGLQALEEEAANLAPDQALPGAAAFKLYDTFGFPLDLTQDILRGKGLGVDLEGFEQAMERQRALGKTSWAGSGEVGDEQVWVSLRDAHGPTAFLGYERESAEATLLAIVVSGASAQALSGEGAAAELVFDRTPFYAESGGQAGDQGVIACDGAQFLVEDTQKHAGLHVHRGRLLSGSLTVGARAQLTIDAGRRGRIRANHSATHLLHAALRRALGPHVAQKGSLVEADRLRFDFSHGAALSPAEIERIEDEVNAVIRQNAAAETGEMSPEEAIAAGALALFGEKYGERVRVLSLGRALESGEKPYSVELCGGTHVARAGDIGAFVITQESGTQAGVRRIEATTGAAALAHLRAQAELARAVAAALKAPLAETPQRVAALAQDKRRLEQELSEAKTRLALLAKDGGGAGSAPVGPETVAGVALLARVLDGVPAKALRSLVDEGKAQIGEGVVAYVAREEGKAAIAVGVSEGLKAKISAVALVQAGVEALGGQGGGGRPDLAQGGGPAAEQAEAAIAAVRARLAELAGAA